MKHYTLILFTGSERNYGEKVANIIDPTNKYFSYKLFRDNCVKTKNKVRIFLQNIFLIKK